MGSHEYLMSSYGRKLFLEWQTDMNRIEENVLICSQDPFRAVNSDRDLATIFCVLEKFSLTAHWRLLGTLLYI